MKSLLYIALFFLFILASCSRHDAFSPTLTSIDSLMESRPDSALKLIESINPQQINTMPDYAYYILLLTQARDKNFIIQKDDSLIQTAIKYFNKRHNTALQARAYYLLGSVYRDMKEPVHAVENYSKAIMYARQSNNHVLLGRIYNQLGFMYYLQSWYTKADSIYKNVEAIGRMLNDSNLYAEAIYMQGKIQISYGKPLDYKYTLAEFFANINVLHAWNELPYQRQLNFADSYLMYSYKYAPVSSKSWLVLGNASKGLDFLKGFVALNANYSLSDMALITEGQAVDYRISAGNMALEVSGQPCNWMDWMYKVSYGFSRLESEISGNESLDNWLHTTDLNFWPVKNLFFTLSGEYYRNEITENNYKDTWMLDAKLTYGWKDFEIYVQTTNLLNKKEYGYNIHSELTSVQCMQRIRGREFLIGFCWKKGG